MIVLLHGNPETPRVWDALRTAWRRDDIVAPALPGFGAPIPSGFGCGMEDYLRWLIAEIERLPRPVHLVGHDWGGILAARLAIVRPDLLASWASDAVGALHPRYVWHDAAQGWQTPDVGEKMMAAMTTPPAAERAAILERIGVPTGAAQLLAEGIDERMGVASLALYRSAAQPALQAWGEGAERATACPGAFLHATADPFVGAALGTKSFVGKMGARVIELSNRGHWWMMEAPDACAADLEQWIEEQSHG
jgi:pimeloyl-ACP methyl ester carboxylesterase